METLEPFQVVTMFQRMPLKLSFKIFLYVYEKGNARWDNNSYGK